MVNHCTGSGSLSCTYADTANSGTKRAAATTR